MTLFRAFSLLHVNIQYINCDSGHSEIGTYYGMALTSLLFSRKLNKLELVFTFLSKKGLRYEYILTTYTCIDMYMYIVAKCGRFLCTCNCTRHTYHYVLCYCV